MPNNTLPSGINHLMALADQMANGWEQYALWLKLTTDPTEAFRAQVQAMRKLEEAFREARCAKGLPEKRRPRPTKR